MYTHVRVQAQPDRAAVVAAVAKATRGAHGQSAYEEPAN